MEVVQRLETHLSRQAGTSMSDLLSGEGAREEGRRAEKYRSFTTPSEAAQLRSPGFDRALSDDRMQDTAVWVRMACLPMPTLMLRLA